LSTTTRRTSADSDAALIKRYARAFVATASTTQPPETAPGAPSHSVCDILRSISLHVGACDSCHWNLHNNPRLEDVGVIADRASLEHQGGAQVCVAVLCQLEFLMNKETLVPARDLAKKRRALFPGESESYRAAREALLENEIEFRRHMTELTEQRQALPPGPLVQKNYRFKDENAFEVGLIDLFGDKDTLVTYFWMYGPQRERPCPMCTNLLGSLNGNAQDIKQRVALKVLGRSSVERPLAFAQERGWRDLNFIQTVGDDYAKDLGLIDKDGFEYPALVVFKRDGDAVRVFWASEMSKEMADPGQDPRGAPDLASLWNVLDLTPGGRGTDWYPKLNY
jgi:predicted dithiol-disulfide oxidoreductase (DUF899 family)